MWNISRAPCSSAMGSCSCACLSARRPGCRNGVICCAFIASLKRAAKSAAGGSLLVFRESSLRCLRPLAGCARCGGRRLRETLISLSGADPLNLAGILTPGPKLPALTGNRVLYRDGIPLALLQGNEVQFLQSLDPRSEGLARMALLGHSEACVLTCVRLAPMEKDCSARCAAGRSDGKRNNQ